MPIPVARPANRRTVVAVDPEETSGIVPADNPAAVTSDLKSGLDALYSKDVGLARSIRDSLPHRRSTATS